MPLSFRVGDTTIHLVVEQTLPFQPIQAFLPTLSDAVLAENRAWLEPAALDPVTGKLVLAIQSWVVRTKHARSWSPRSSPGYVFAPMTTAPRARPNVP